jgi:hypothetical protein
MVLGKKHDPTQEQAFKDILNLGKRTALIGHRFWNGFSYWLTRYFQESALSCSLKVTICFFQ